MYITFERATKYNEFTILYKYYVFVLFNSVKVTDCMNFYQQTFAFLRYNLILYVNGMDVNWSNRILIFIFNMMKYLTVKYFIKLLVVFRVIVNSVLKKSILVRKTLSLSGKINIQVYVYPNDKYKVCMSSNETHLTFNR